MNPYNCQEYMIIREKALSNKFYKVFILLFLIGMIFLIYRFDFKVYEKYIIFKDNDKYNLIVSVDDIDYITNNNYIFINNKRYYYKIDKISNEYQNINGTLFKNIIILIKNYKMDNDYNYCYFLRRSDTFFNMIIKFIKGGFYG